MVAAAKGYKLIVTMPDTMSKERRNLLSAYGAEIVLTPGSKGMKGAIEKANELVTEHNYYMPQQFNNEANPHVHAVTTGKEILTQIPDGLDAFISGVGTGGTITGRSEEHTSELPSRGQLVCRLLLEKQTLADSRHDQV